MLQAWSIVQTPDSGFAVGGTYNSPPSGGDFLVVKLDANGTLLWNRKIGCSLQEQNYDMTLTADGGFAMTGWIAGDGQGNGGSDIFFVKLDDRGMHEWSKRIGGPTGPTNHKATEGHSVIQTSDGGYAVCGYNQEYRVPDNSDDFYVVKINSVSDYQSTLVIGEGGKADNAVSMIETQDGSLLVAGYLGNGSSSLDTYQSYIVRLTTSGTDTLQTRKIGSESREDRIHSIIQTLDGGYAALGFTESFGAGAMDIYFAKLDSAGNANVIYDTCKMSFGGAIAINHRIDSVSACIDSLTLNIFAPVNTIGSGGVKYNVCQ